jgi:hypothetical protein
VSKLLAKFAKVVAILHGVVVEPLPQLAAHLPDFFDGIIRGRLFFMTHSVPHG